MKELLKWVLVLGVSSVLATGCVGGVSKKSRSQSATARIVSSPAASGANSDDEGDGESDAQEEGSSFSSGGTPESLAHFAAGVSHSLRNEEEAALNEFYQSAQADPTNEPVVIEVARRLAAKKQPDKALEILLKSAARSDSTSLLWCHLAQVQLGAGQTNQALASARKAVARAPDFLDAYQTLFAIELDRGDLYGARSALKRAAARAGTNALEQLTVAQLYAEYLRADPKNRPELRAQALAMVDRVASTNLSDQLTLTAALTYERLDEPTKAARLFAPVVEKRPTPGNREKLAELYLAAGEKKKAAQELELIVREAPLRYPQVWHMLGALANEVKEYAGAVNFFQKTIQLAPNMEQAYYDLALAQIEIKQEERALETLKVAAARFPNTFYGEYITGLAYGRIKDWPKAASHLTQAEVIAKASATKDLDYHFYFQCGATAERNHQFPQAVEYFETCLKLKPDYFEAMNYLGYMWAERGENLPRAATLIDRAVKAQPTNAAFLDSKGWILHQQGKHAQSLPWLLKACDLSQEPDATVFEHVGDVYLVLGLKEKAREAWQKSLNIESNAEVKKKLDSLQGNPP